ncbi:MAG: putative rane protein [Gemmatimonadetes bacterium]|nr:putative rane protein [Gemmatimonadota bacterium]
MKAILWFGMTVVLIVLVCGLLLAIPFSSGDERRAIEASAGVAIIVQLFAFAIARLAAQRSFLAGWITGAAMRFVTLIVYALVAVKLLAMPAPAALISLVTFLFISTLVEPKFLTL